MSDQERKIQIEYVGASQTGTRIDGIFTYTTTAATDQVNKFIQTNWLDEKRVVIGGGDEKLMLDFGKFSAFNYTLTEIKD